MRASGGIHFVIDVKGGEKEVELDDRGSMSIAINNKGGDCWMKLKLSLMPIIDVKGHLCQN